MVLIGSAIVVLAGVLAVGLFRISRRIAQVRAAVQKAEPTITCVIGSHHDAGSGMQATVFNAGQVQAFDLTLSLPTMEQAWHTDSLVPGRRVKLQIAIPQYSPLFTSKLDDPVATLTFADRIGLRHQLRITLEQAPRADSRFDLRSTDARPERPTLTKRTLWSLRNQL